MRLITRTCAATLSIVISHAAMAEPIAVAMPSVAKVGQSVEAAGQGHAAGELVNLRLTFGNGQVSTAAVTADAQGRFKYSVLPPAPGKAVLQVLDAQGKQTAAATAVVTP